MELSEHRKKMRRDQITGGLTGALFAFALLNFGWQIIQVLWWSVMVLTLQAE